MTLKHTLSSLFASLVLLGTIDASAQAPKPKPARKGFDLAPKGKKAVVPAIVVPDSGELQAVKVLEVNRGGTANTEKLRPNVEAIELWSNGTMRWKFSMSNPTEQDVTTDLNFSKCYVADAAGNRYPSSANEFNGNGDEDYRLQVPPGLKAPFWIEFPAPQKPTKTFRVGLIVNGSFGSPFKQFSVTLSEEIGPKPVVAAPKAATADTPEPAAELSAVMEAFSTQGLTYQGTAKLKSGVTGMVTLAFETLPGDGDALRVRMSSTRLPQLTKTLTGRILEQDDPANGLTIVLIGPDGAAYRLDLKAKTLKGADTNGTSFTLTAK